ncbi:hypothetical protein KR100_08080 [Synechococcus sp. KORDI-100]|nr:hypothetical protein KR100_08080 [Synechococcus sp. KORDI-100]
MLHLSEATALFFRIPLHCQQAVVMAAFIHHQQRPLRSRLRHWQQVRTWARLIREAEALWHVDVRALRRLGAVELSQLIEEVPATHRRRVNRWLDSYSVATRLHRVPSSQRDDNAC